MFDPNPFVEEFNNEPVQARMEDVGYYIFHRRLEPEVCATMRGAIDVLAEADETEVNYAGSEHRVWHAAAKDPIFAPVETLSNACMPTLYGRPSEAVNVLAIRNRPAPSHAERFDVRWHIDSFQKQLKLFLFLTDVTEDDGPFEYIPQTHRKSFKYLNAIPLGYYGLRDLKAENRGKRSWQRIHDDTVEKVFAKGFASVPMTVGAGTFLLADTSALHRARPCLSGERYAVTIYHK